MSNLAETRGTRSDWRAALLKLSDAMSMPALAMFLGFAGGALIILITSGSLETVVTAYVGLINGAFFKTRGFSETLVAMTPYVFLGLGLAVGFKAGLFNIGVEGQFYIGAVSAVWAGIVFTGLPTFIHLPLVILAGAVGGAIWAGIPAILKTRTGAHEVITTMMMNYIAFRLSEFLVSVPLRDTKSSAVQTLRVSPNAELWSLYQIPERLQDPLNALFVAMVFAFIGWTIAEWIFLRPNWVKRWARVRRHTSAVGIGLAVGLVTFIGLPLLTRAWWPLNDQYDRMHIGIFMAFVAAIAMWRIMWKTTVGLEMRTVGANPDAAKYAGINSTRTIIITMLISGGLAGIAGTIEVLGVSICRCLPLFFSSGYGFDSIAIALIAKNNPLGILGAAFMFGAMRNGADLMELQSGVSKHVISLIQALVLLFVAAPSMVRWMLRMKAARQTESEQLTRRWGA
jgi:simple sugar transport system permease protein